MTCCIIVPRQYHLVGGHDEDYLAECILSRCHLGPHVTKTPEGKFIAWEDDWECGCCEPEAHDRCYNYWEIKETDIPSLGKERTP
jgi:hypothetical protein